MRLWIRLAAPNGSRSSVRGSRLRNFGQRRDLDRASGQRTRATVTPVAVD